MSEAFKVKGLPWSSGLGKDVKGCLTSSEVMKKAGLDFTVEKCPLVGKMPFSLDRENKVDENMGDFVYNGSIYKDCPNAFGTYRTDYNYLLGVVKSKYEVVQNVDAFKFFDNAIGPNNAEWQYAGHLGLGHKIFVTAKLPIKTTVGKDEINNYLVFSNTHDGSGSINILFTPIRVICTNCLNSAFKNADAYIRLRHTKNVHDKLEIGSQILKVAIDHAKSAQELYQALEVIKMSDEQVKEYIAKLCLTDGEMENLINYDKTHGLYRLFRADNLLLESTKISTRKCNQMRQMMNYYTDGIGQKEIAGTAWGAYNAITGYYSNVANLNGEKRFESLLYGNANRVMNDALVEAYEYR